MLFSVDDSGEYRWSQDVSGRLLGGGGSSPSDAVGGGLVTDTEGVVAWFGDEDGGGVKGWVDPFAGC